MNAVIRHTPRDPSPCWCGVGQWKSIIHRRPAGLVRCNQCGTYRTDPPPLSSDEEGSEFYSEYYESNLRDQASAPKPTDTPLAYNSRFWNVARQHPPLMQSGSGVLDVGCGSGRLCAELSQYGWSKVCGLDVSKARIARARCRFPNGTYFDQPLEELKLPPESFELIILDNVIEHLASPLHHLRVLERLLRSNGRIVLITPNLESGHFRLLGRWWTPELAPRVHIFLFTPTAINRLMQEAGFEVEAAGTFQFDFKAPKFSISKAWVWRWMQEFGTLYSQMIDAGPMLYTVAKRVHLKTDSQTH